MHPLLLLAATCLCLGGQAQTNEQYDAALAKKLGADEHGMRMYSFTMLRTGPATGLDKAVVDSCFRGHMANIGQLVESGDLIVAGPLGKNSHGYRGLFVFTKTDTTLVRQLLNNDPAIAIGLLAADIYPWYGSAALPTYLENADKVWQVRP